MAGRLASAKRQAFIGRLLPLLGIAALASCSVGSPNRALTPSPGGSGGLATFRDGGLTFSYPAAWRIFHHTVVSSFSSSIADLATVDVPDPCITSTDATGTSTSCGDRFHLEPGTLVVHITSNGFPGFNVLEKPAGAMALVVDGMPGYLESGPPPEDSTGADESLSWTLARPTFVDNYFRIQALLRGPDLSVLTGQLDAMISSLRYDPPVVPLPTSPADRDAALARAIDALGVSSPAWRCFPAHPG